MANQQLPLTLARAGTDNGETAVAPGTASAIPPDFPDAIHVPHGCYISTAAYLAKFTAAFPVEFATPLTIHPQEYKGPHTVALMSWQQRWWLRDELLGVLPLNEPVESARVTERLRRRAQGALDHHAGTMSKRTRNRMADADDRLTQSIDPLRDVATAATLLPLANEQFRVQCQDRDVALLFFRPGPGRIGVYDPLTGTLTADCANNNSAEIIAFVADRLGYQVVSIRPTSPAGFAAAGP